jgi:hypothetical protein
MLHFAKLEIPEIALQTITVYLEKTEMKLARISDLSGYFENIAINGLRISNCHGISTAFKYIKIHIKIYLN